MDNEPMVLVDFLFADGSERHDVEFGANWTDFEIDLLTYEVEKAQGSAIVAWRPSIPVELRAILSVLDQN
jgi:hypothetical protein